MAKPSLNYYEVVQVAKQKSDVVQYTTVQAAITAITARGGPLETKRFAVYIHPGTYTEPVTLVSWVDLVGQGDRGDVVITQVGGTVLTAGAITCNLKNIKVTDTNSGVCLDITGDGTISCENCEFNSDTDAITMANGTLTLENCVVADGDIELSGAACTLSMDHTEMVGGNLNAVGEFVHIISCVYCDFHGNDLDNNANGAGSLIVRNCANIGTLDDHFVTDGYTTTIENSVINTAATKNGTVAWVIKDCYLEDIQNINGTGSVTISGGYVKECTNSAGPIVWYEPESNEFRVITGMKIQHALNVATSTTVNDTIHIGPGIFAEALTIGTGGSTVPVTLQGDGRGVTIIRQVAGIPLSITNEDGVLVRDLSIEVTEAAGHQGILCHNTTATDLTLILYNVLIDVDATGETTDHGIRLYRTDTGTFALHMTQCEIDVHNTAGAGAQITYGVSLEAGDGALTKSEFKESYISSTCDAAGTEYGIYISTVACDLDVYNSVILDGIVYTLNEALAHSLVFVQCDFNNQDLNSAATGGTTLDMSGCSYVGTVTNAGTGAFTIRDSDVSAINGTGAGANTFYGGFLGAVTRGVGATVWWKNDSEIWVLPSTTTADPMIQSAIEAANADIIIHIAAGTFAEALVIDATDEVVTLQGSGPDKTIISQTNATVLTVADQDGVVVRDLKIRVTAAATATAIACSSTTDTPHTLTLYNVVVDVDAPGATTDYGIRLTVAADGEFLLHATQLIVEIDTAGAGTAYGISLEGGYEVGPPTVHNELHECYIRCTTAAGTEYAVSMSAVVTMLEMYNSHIEDGSIFTAADALAHTLVFVQCDLNNGGVDSDATGGTTLNAYGCSYMGLLANNGSGNWECRDSDVGGVDFTAAGTLTLSGGDLESITKASASVVWWRDSVTLYVLPSATTTDTVLQYAIAAASVAGGGQTIYIGPGTFTETIVIDTATEVVTLIGSGTDKTIITRAGTDVLQVTGCGTVCVENLTLQGTAMDNDQVVNLDSTAASASLTMRKVLVSAARTANVAYAIYLQGGGDYNTTLILDDCTVTAVGDATTHGVHSATAAGGGANTCYFYNCFIEAATSAGADCGDSLNISADGTVHSYNTTYSVSDINIGNVATCIMRSHNDNILCPITKAADGIMTCKSSPQVYDVWNGMEIGDAITAAAGETPTDTFRFTVKVHEGEYNEAVTMAQFIDLVGDSGESVVIYQSGANVIAAAADSRIRNVRVELLAGSDDSAIYVNNVTGVVIEECTITVARTSGNNSGILTDGTGGAEVYRCSIEATAAEDAAIVCQGTGATELYNNDLNGGLADINLNADVDSDLQTYNNNCRGAGFRIVAVDTYNVYAHGDVFKTVTHLLAAGVRGHMFLQNEPNIALVREGMYITDGIALATADTPGAANPWKVQVGPGVYTEQITMDDYVNVIAEGGYEVTSIFHECAAADDEATVTMESNCRLEGFTIISDGNDNTYEARCITSIEKSNWLIKDCLFSHVDSSAAGGADNQCVFIDTSGTGLRLEHCRWRSGTIAAPTTDDIKRALQVDADGIEVLLQDCETYSDTTAATDSDFFLNEGKVETRNCMIRGSGWYISDNATSIGISWDDDWEGTKVIQVTFAGTSGQFADLSGARLYICTVNETLGEAVYISAADTVDEATNAAATPLPAEGIIVYKPSNVLCYVKKHGYVYLADPATLIGVAFTAGGNIWLGATAGKWLNAEPSNAIKQVLGVAKGPTGAGAAKEFLIDISLVVIETASFADHTPTGGVLSIPIAWGAGSAATGTHISNNARRAVAIVNAAGQTVFSQAVDIPSDYLHDATNNKLFAVLFPTGGVATDIDWTAYTSCASHGEDEAFHSDTATAADQDVDDDEILFLDISAAFLTTYAAQEGDVLSIELIIDAMDAPVTQVNVLEFKLIYTRQV